jgi:hypothetical protein
MSFEPTPGAGVARLDVHACGAERNFAFLGASIAHDARRGFFVRVGVDVGHGRGIL